MSKRTLVMMCSIFLIVPLLFMGCMSDGDKGDKGNPGAPGATGDTGATGPAGPITTTNESCMVCHTTGRIADITDQEGGVHYAKANSLPNLAVAITDLTDNGEGLLEVSFNITVDGTAYDALADNSIYFFAADLVPADTLTTADMLNGLPQSTPQFERWAFERTGTFNTAGIGQRDYVFGSLDKTDAANGNYVYTFATALGSTTEYDNAVHFSAADTQRLYIRAAHPVANTYTPGVAFVDFTVVDDGAGTLIVNNPDIGYLSRQFVTIDACQKCHGPKNQVMDHGSSYMDINACVICHSPIINANNGAGGGSPETKSYMFELWFGNLIHKIHAALGSTLVKQQADAEFPQDVRNCVVCHTNSGKDLGAGDNTDNWKTHPSAAYCGTCHVAANFVTGDGHAGGAQPDTSCGFCHPSTGHVAPALGASITEAHDTSATAVLHPNPKNVPEFDVTLSLSAPAGTSYVAGEEVTVTATLAFHGGAAVPGTLYTSARGNNGITDNLLRTASVYIYGPRAFPKPIFAPTDNTQAHSMFVGTVDASGTVATDNTGFKYTFTVPSGLANGTYMVRVRFADYGYVSDTDYQMESVAFQTIQIGTATTSLKVAGDSCVNCHGAGTAPFHDARHVVAWDTDECISCHDYSGGHAATLANRVHAVHSENSMGDMINPLGGPYTSRDWSGITYPQNVNNCSTCHISGNLSYRSVVHEVSCLGCHGDDPAVGGATNHMLQNGGHYPVAAP